MTIKRYTSEDLNKWDEFVNTSRNGMFMFLRGYMDYHSNRFKDHSLMFFNSKNNLIALLPACEIDESPLTSHLSPLTSGEKILSSHSGLTYGGFILNKTVKATDVLELFTETRAYLESHGFTKLIYKSIPYIYHLIPSSDDEYALWMNGATLDVCNLSTTIDLHSGLTLNADYERVRRKHKAETRGIVVEETDDFTELWKIAEKLLLEKYGVKPVHTVEEISLLHSRFPNNIRCIVAKLDGEVLGGIVIYESKQVAHAQYAEASEMGKTYGVVDLLYLHIINYYKAERQEIRYFDFGISNEDRGRYLNRSLIFYKEDFGGRGVVYKTYILPISSCKE